MVILQTIIIRLNDKKKKSYTMKKVTITLEEKVLNFVGKQARRNRSNYINQLLKETYQKQLEKEMIEALQDDAKSPEYKQEIRDWDAVTGDGIE